MTRVATTVSCSPLVMERVAVGRISRASLSARRPVGRLGSNAPLGRGSSQKQAMSSTGPSKGPRRRPFMYDD